MPMRPLDPARLQPWSLVVWEQLGDGLWQSLEEVIGEGCRAVPPGLAYRKAAAGRHYDDKIAVTGRGRRMVVQEVIRGLVRSGRLERREHPHDQQSWQLRRVLDA